MRMIYVSDGNYVRGPDGGWYTTAAFPLRFIAEQLPELEEFCFWGRLGESDNVQGLVRLDTMIPSATAAITFAGPVGQRPGPFHYLTKGIKSLPQLRKRVREADVLWAKLPFVYAVLGWRFRRPGQLKITQQGGDPRKALKYAYPRMGIAGKFLGWACRRCAAQADIATFVSKDMKSRYGREARETLVFHNSRLTREMLWRRTDAEMHSPFRLLYVGRLSHEKGLEFVIRALRHLEDVELRVIGTGYARAELEALAADLGVADKVHWMGRLQWGQELFSAMREGDASILPSFTEGFPLAVVDAMSQSLPVIGSRVGGIPEIVEDGYNGILIEPGSVDQIVEAINRIRSHDLWTTLHRGAFETGKENTLETQLGKLLALVRRWWEARAQV